MILIDLIIKTNNEVTMKMFKSLAILMIALAGFAFTTQLGPDKTISEVVAEREDLSTLLSALDAAELTETLKGEGPYTVFAPTNDGFNALPDGKLDELMMPESKDALTKTLKYHVVSGEYYASDLYDGQELETLDGTKITVKGSGASHEEGMMDEEGAQEDVQEEVEQGMQQGQASGLKINNASLVEQDIEASNGVIHVIDAVIMPTPADAIGTVEDEF